VKYELLKHFLTQDSVMLTNGIAGLIICFLAIPVDLMLLGRDDGNHTKQINALAYTMCILGGIGVAAMWAGMSLKYR